MSKLMVQQDDQTDNITHTLYIKLFRVNQCQEFLNGRCRRHKPFSCFNWHMPSQRRRPVVKDSDYSTDVYCPKYDELSGYCPHGDTCPLLHRNVGDTEYMFHPKFYKTVICTRVSDSDGNCPLNGKHCPYAHGIDDLRSPPAVLTDNDARCKPPANASPALNLNGIGNLLYDKNRLPKSNDRRWMSVLFVYTFYKTKPCTPLKRSCRPGYICSSWHDDKDSRRSPQLYNYLSTPCPNVKTNNVWSSPLECPNGVNCIYCHTRGEQQFHVDIYKSSKCKDIIRVGYCPRGVFCAFSHAEVETEAVNSIKMALAAGKTLPDLFGKVHV